MQSVLMSRETYKNIGAFTVDHHVEVLVKMKPNVFEEEIGNEKGTFQGGST